jgi:AcrR family transcriptional regulator
MDSSPGRRETNKQRTRSALERAAAHLFEENGFAATTVRDIAAAAGVGERTFFRYFPSKEDLVLQQARDLIPGLMDGVRRRPAGEPELTALCEVIVAWLEKTGTTPTILVSGPLRDERHHVEAHALKLDLESAITEAFLDRLEAAGADRHAAPTVLRATVEAGAGVAALRGFMIAYPGDGSGAAPCTGVDPESRESGESRTEHHDRRRQPNADPSERADEKSPSATEIAARVREAFAVLGAA